jgi:outer membrane biosynthesis protein TonB
MDNKTAKNKLRELRDSLSKVLDGKEYSSSEEIKEQSAEAIQQARKASSTLKKSFIEKIKDLPVVQKVSELGTAGSVAVSTAAVAQTTVAIDQTEVFVASVANDVIEERIEVPMFIDTFVDFHYLNDWGQVVMQEKVEAAQDFVEKAEAIAAPAPSQYQSPSSGGSKPSSSEPSPSQETGGKNEQQPSDDKSEKQSEKEAKAKEKSPSEETKSDSKKDKEEKQKQPQGQKAEYKKQSQQNNSSSEPSTESRGVNNQLPIIETPFESMDAEVNPHRQVSPI